MKLKYQENSDVLSPLQLPTKLIVNISLVTIIATGYRE